MFTGTSRFRVNDPVFFPYLRENEVGELISLKLVVEFSPEESFEGFNVKEELFRRREPLGLIFRDSSPRDDIVDMGVKG
jgi:hypothetical protein